MAAAERAERAPPRRSRTDLLWVAAAAGGSYALASALELHEFFVRWVARYERWQLDELLFTAVVLACGLAWFAWRRRQEAQAALQLCERAEAHASSLLAHNRELARQLISVQENERVALARELHDELGQGCSVIRVETGYLRRCSPDNRAGLMAAAERADLAAQALYRGVHGLLRRLRPANLDTLGLVAALQELCDSWSRRSGMPCSFRAEGAVEALGDGADITLYRVTQEALTNVMRHADASRVQVNLWRDAQAQVCLTIEDDGRGMSPAASHRGLGLLGAAERAAIHGGELRLHSEPGTGLRVQLTLPVQDSVCQLREAA
jgi:two-component system sensor histidine kinase UhpB